MKLRWLWRICPCRRCHGFRINRAYVEVMLQDMRETTGADEFTERKTYAYGVFTPAPMRRTPRVNRWS